MKFVKSDLAKKLIIILIALLIFNIAIPPEVKAVDFGGILFQPIVWLIMSFVVPTDMAIGLLINGISATMNFITIITNLLMGDISGSVDSYDNMLSLMFVGPDTIFSGKMQLFNANIFDHLNANPTNNQNGVNSLVGAIEDVDADDENIMEKILNGLGISTSASDWKDQLDGQISPAFNLVNSVGRVVARFYVILRNIAALVMLAGLIFTGIRILLSSNVPTKKTQYLMLLQDWLIGMVLLIFSHIIMILVFEVSDALVNWIRAEVLGLGGMKVQLIKNLLWNWELSGLLIGLIMYLYLGWLTLVFAISYIKRFFWVCILIVFAPVFSVMYAFGQQTKQIYSQWLKEYILTVFVQPFHLVIYTVLISIPLGLGTNSGTINMNLGSGLFEFVYALIAMSFIRPAEKYMRGLFGMNKGVANMASYDSGKQTFDAVKTAAVETVKTVAKVAVLAAATAATGGAAAGAAGALGAAGAAGGGAAAAGGAASAVGAGGSAAGALGAGEAAGALGGEAAGALGGEAGGMLGEGGMSIGGDMNLGSLGDGNLNADGILKNDMNDGFGQNSLGEYFNPYTDEYDPNYNPLHDPAYGGSADIDDFSDADIKQLSSEIKDGIGSGENGGQINAANVTITASSVNMEGNANLASGNEVAQAIEEAEIGEANESTPESIETDDIELLGGSSANFMDTFKNLGGFEAIAGAGNEAYKGLHSITDTLYVDGQAPQDWKASSQRTDNWIKESSEKRKEKVDREKDNWAHNKANIQIMTDKYMSDPSFREKFSDKPEAYVRRQAEEKAKAALKDMSEYVPYGITDVNTAYGLYKHANDNGLSPQQALLSTAGYNKFNTSAENVAQINMSSSFTRNDYRTVEEAIPNAQIYYNGGYTDVNDMAWVEKIAQSLGKSPEFAMKVDQTLRSKGGRINYKGTDKAMKDVIDQINANYGG